MWFEFRIQYDNLFTPRSCLDACFRQGVSICQPGQIHIAFNAKYVWNLPLLICDSIFVIITTVISYIECQEIGPRALWHVVT